MWPPFETNVPYFEPGPGLSPLLLAMIGCSIGCIYYLLSIVCLPETMICVPLNLSLPERRDGVSCHVLFINSFALAIFCARRV